MGLVKWTELLQSWARGNAAARDERTHVVVACVDTPAARWLHFGVLRLCSRVLWALTVTLADRLRATGKRHWQAALASGCRSRHQTLTRLVGGASWHHPGSHDTTWRRQLTSSLTMHVILFSPHA